MRPNTLISFAVALASTWALADTPTLAPKMIFRAVRTEPQMSAFNDKVSAYRTEDTVIVVVKDTVLCGQKPIDASFAIGKNEIALRYELTPPPSGGTTKCTLASEFVINNVPHRDLAISFSSGSEPTTTVSMQKCPNYSPKTDDVWECLVPATKK